MTLSNTDRLDIYDLLARADNAASRRDAATYVSYFTEDCVLEGAKGEYRGRDALAGAVGPIWASEAVSYTHLVSASTLATSARTSARNAASREAKGSSSSTKLGRVASARARATRCCIPPDSWWG